MLIYDQALDPYHSAVRILSIALSAADRGVELSIDTARIADYFLVYPFKLSEFMFPAEFRPIRKAVKETENPYRHVAGMKSPFERMRSIFTSSASGLVAAGFINAEELKRGVVKLANIGIPEELLAAVERFRKRQTEVGHFILTDLLSIPANGVNGLKHRSKLLEYRYDIA